MVIQLRTVGEVIEALGGPTKIARIVKRTPQAICGWRREGRLARSSLVLLTRELEKRGFTAPPDLWGMQ